MTNVGTNSLRCGLLVAAGLLLGCRREKPGAPDEVGGRAERGPLALSVSATPAHALVGDWIRLTLSFQGPIGTDVQFPAAAELGKGLEIRSEPAPPPQPAESGQMIWKQEFSIQALASGPTAIGPFTVRYLERSAASAATATGGTVSASAPAADDWQELAADAVSVEVRSVLTSRDSMTSPRDITGTLLPPRKPLTPLQKALIAAAALCAVALAWMLWRVLKSRAARAAPVIAPDVWALAALEKLRRSMLVESGQAREFYYQLTSIVREYIERKFALAAPEMTTEEFLVSLSRAARALPCDPEQLGRFLSACDLVKYAAFAPDPADAQAALEAARAFVASTAAASSATLPPAAVARPA